MQRNDEAWTQKKLALQRRRLQQSLEGVQAMQEYQDRLRVEREKMTRLRAQRLAREANVNSNAGRPASAAKPRRMTGSPTNFRSGSTK
jgi:hypothetical protein